MTHPCPVCAEPYARRHRLQRYCSQRCRYLHRQSRKHGVAPDAYLRMRVADQERACPVCERTFLAPRVATGKGSPRIYCSDRCNLLQSRLRYLYGITYADYRALLRAQDFTCRLCPARHDARTPQTRLHIDHDHQTGTVRGLLCMPCNHLLGWYEKRQDALDAYLAPTTHRHGGKLA